MNILINASNLKKGGGIQVCDSICKEIYKYTNKHNFFLVLSHELEYCLKYFNHTDSVSVFIYDININLRLFLTGNDKFLDKLVNVNNVDVVLTIFGPSFWIPKCSHVCGFAIPHIVFRDSPFFKLIPFYIRVKYYLKSLIREFCFKYNSQIYFTENYIVTKRLKEIFPSKTIYTITNNYNQVFDYVDLWDNSIVLPKFDGVTLLTVSANYLHKNLSIFIPCVHILKSKYPDLNFRFVLTINKNEYPDLTSDELAHFIFLGPIKIDQCPNLYIQSDIMILPSLLECFSASYAESMKMMKPIITTDLEFSHSLCGDAAEYYDPLSPTSLADSIYKLSIDKLYGHNLVNNGIKQLEKFDTSEGRTMKIIHIIESLKGDFIK